jgi:prepilin-type N-terminal cleavage/methylation domain-containing protein
MPRFSISSSRRRPRGFTLLELLVVGMIGSIVLIGIANTWRWYSRSMYGAQRSTQLTRELKLSADAMAHDFGPAIAVRALDSATVQFNIDAGTPDGVAQWADPDTVIEYALQSQKLIRRDLSTNAEVPLAAHIKTIETETVGGKLQVHLTAEFRDEQQSITLEFEE